MEELLIVTPDAFAITRSPVLRMISFYCWVLNGFTSYRRVVILDFEVQRIDGDGSGPDDKLFRAKGRIWRFFDDSRSKQRHCMAFWLW
jgi:hypothetical protein